MENYPFRTAPIGGFNRDDVTAYIKKTRDEADARTARLEDRVRELQETCESQRQALETAGSEREELSRPRAAWRRRSSAAGTPRTTGTPSGRRQRPSGPMFPPGTPPSRT